MQVVLRRGVSVWRSEGEGFGGSKKGVEEEEALMEDNLNEDEALKEREKMGLWK